MSERPRLPRHLRSKLWIGLPYIEGRTLHPRHSRSPNGEVVAANLLPEVNREVAVAVIVERFGEGLHEQRLLGRTPLLAEQPDGLHQSAAVERRALGLRRHVLRQRRGWRGNRLADALQRELTVEQVRIGGRTLQIIIGLLQLAALAYGLWTVAVARPVHLVFEIDRFRVVHAIDVPPELLDQAPAGLRPLPLAGPTLLSVREFKNAQENFEATMAAIQGVALGARPDLWQAYEQAKAQIKARARPVGELKNRFPDHAAEIDQALKSASSAVRAMTSVGYVPLASRDTFWTVLIDTNTTEVIAFVPIDSF